MKIQTLFLLLLFIIAGCQSNDRQSNTEGIPIIDLSKNHPEKKIILQDIADVEYVPLETTDDVLLSQLSILSYVSDKYIIIHDLMQYNIYVFSRNGKIISYLNRKGQGPQEYVSISGPGVIFDEKNEEIFVLNFPSYRFLVYSIYGEYKRTLHYSENLRGIFAHNFNDEALLIYNNDRLVLTENYSETPFLLISKKDGSVISNINIRLPIRYSNRTVVPFESGGQVWTTADYIPTRYNWFDGEDFILSDISSDTIYRITKLRNLTPILVRNPSVQSSDPPIVWSTLLTTDKFIILQKTILDFVSNKEYETLIYEFNTGKTSKVSFVNADLGGQEFHLYVIGVGVDVPKNMHAAVIYTKYMKNYYEEKQKKGELRGDEKIPDEEDNPFVMIVKFK